MHVAQQTLESPQRCEAPLHAAHGYAAPVRYEELEEAYTRWDIARWHSEVRKEAGWELVLEESAARFDALAEKYEAQHNSDWTAE